MGGFGDWISDQFGSKNNFKAGAVQVDNADPYKVGEVEAFQNRKGEQIDQSRSDQYANLGLQARTDSMDVANAMRSRALGGNKSIAEMQADRQMQQAVTAQAAQAASARGAGGLALAQQNAANNIANTQGAISGQAQVNAAQERMAAEAAAMQAYGQVRGQDQASQAQFAQQALAQANLNQQQRAQNDQAFLNARGVQGQTGMAYNSQRSANQQFADQLNAGIAGQNAQMAQANAMGAIKMVSDGAAMAMGVPPMAKGGPIAIGSPYIVGEEGPELIIPQQSGTVLPTDQTRNALANMAPAYREQLAPEQSAEQARNMSDEEMQKRAQNIIAAFRAGLGYK